MLAMLRAHLTYANVMATVAVFVALGGSSYAAVKLAKNSVKSKHIAKGAVKRSDIAKRSVNSAKVADFSLLAKDFKAGQIPAGPQGTAGPKGDTGAKGDTGEPGEAGTAVAYATIASDGTLIPTKSKNITAANIDPDTQTGIVCFTGLPFTARNAMVAPQGIFNGGQPDVIASPFVTLGASATGDCSGQVQVRTFDVSDGALADRPFLIWFED